MVTVARNGVVVFAEEGGQNHRYNLNDVGRIEFNAAGQGNRYNSDNYGNDQHSVYDKYGNRPDYRDNQPQGGAINAKYQDMARAGIGLGQPMSPEQTSSDGEGRFRVYQNSTVYWSPRTGAHEVHGAIREQYMQLGAENSRLGYPISDEEPATDGSGGRMNRFEHGVINWNSRTGAAQQFGR
ncbi:MAG: hypothetical protein ABJC09_00100 [Terriglobia bacterium]